MNWKKEIDRIELDFMEVDHCSMIAYYKIGNIYFKVNIEYWKNNYDLVDEPVLNAGDYTKVAPGEYHQFEALEDTVAFELYWAEFDHTDIERETVGFAKDE